MGLKPEEIGVIGFYRHQCTTVRNFIRNTFESDITNLIEVNTADQYQGRDKRAIIITFVWTDETEVSTNHVSIRSSNQSLAVSATRTSQGSEATECSTYQSKGKAYYDRKCKGPQKISSSCFYVGYNQTSSNNTDQQ